MATGHEIAMGLRAAYWSMHRRTNACLGRYGATAEQFVVLALLAEQDGITQQELCRRANSDPNTMRAILVLLEGRGLVSRDQHPTDGRARSVIITPKGRQIFSKLSKSLRPLQDQLRTLFRSKEASNLVTFLGRVAQAMTAAGGGQGEVGREALVAGDK